MVGNCEQGVVAPGGVTPLTQVLAPRVSAMVSPALTAGIRVFGNGDPAAGAPALTDAVSPERPCDGSVLLPATWQPLQVFVSPGINCNQLSCRAPMRRAFLSSTSMVNGTWAGNSILTEPSGSTGAYARISRMPIPAGPNAEALIFRTVLSGISTAFSILTKRAGRESAGACLGSAKAAISGNAPLVSALTMSIPSKS